ncbi:MAG: flagellar hook-length control protein FliK [Candidatus Latescibacteria bacterium]|nr:flagellar hook-length control protein FliK [Candidatus Latescibacterota bacterium]
MVAVVPSAPKHQVPQGPRTPRPAAGGADFGRVLEETTQESQPAPEPEPAREGRAPQAEPGAAPQPEDRAPAPADEQQTGAEGQDQEPEREKGQDRAPATPAPQLFIPLPAAETAKTAAAQVHPLNPEALPPPVPVTGALPALPVVEAEHTRSPAEGESTPSPAADPLPAEQQLDLENLQPKAAERAPDKYSSAELLNFGELLRPDLRTDISPEPVLDQLQQAVNAALLEESAQLVMPQVVRGLATLVSQGMSEMRLQLQPEDLGEIEVRVRTSEGVVRGEMMVQNPEVKHLLDQHLDRLRNALQQQGLDLRGFDIGLAPDGRFGQPDRSWQRSQSRGGAGRQAVAPAPAETALPILAPRGAQAVDYLA